MADVPKPAADAPAADGGAVPAAANVGGAAAPAAQAVSPTVAAVANSGEPPFKLKLEPSDVIIFKTDKYPPEDGAVIDVKITNTTKQLQCYKVKCTSNEIFRVRPPLGYVKQDETFTVKFSLIAKALPNLTRHFFAFYHVGVEDDSKTARQVWTPTTKPDGVIRVPVKFLKIDGTPWTSAEATFPPPNAGAPAAGGGSAPAKPAADVPAKPAADVPTKPAADVPAKPAADVPAAGSGGGSPAPAAGGTPSPAK